MGPSCLSIPLCGVRLVRGKTTRSEYCPPSRRRVPPGEGSASASVGPRLRSQKSSSSIGGGNRLGGRSAAQRWIAAGRAAMGTAKSHLVQLVPLCLVGRHLLHRGRARGRENRRGECGEGPERETGKMPRLGGGGSWKRENRTPATHTPTARSTPGDTPRPTANHRTGKRGSQRVASGRGPQPTEGGGQNEKRVTRWHHAAHVLVRACPV